MNWDWAIGMPLFVLMEAAARNHANLFVAREVKRNAAIRYKAKLQPGTIAVEVTEGKITDIWLVE